MGELLQNRAPSVHSTIADFCDIIYIILKTIRIAVSHIVAYSQNGKP